MTCSAARLEANRRNARRSTGPVTERGKARSRANGLKHGLTGEGVVVHPQDQAEVDRRTQALATDLRPSNELSAILVGRLAMLSVRMERSGRQEIAAVADRVRHADRDYLEARASEVDALIAATATDPAASTRRLRQTPDGIDALVDALLGLGAALDGPWDADWARRLENLRGRAFDDSPKSRIKAIVQACWGYLSGLKPEDGAGLGPDERRAWARAHVSAMIEDEVADLDAIREALDLEAFEASRAEAPDRALFDPSKEATLARKYEAATQRAFFRTLDDFQKLEQAAREATPEPEPAPPPPEESAPLASSFPDEPEEPEAVARALGSSFPPSDRTVGVTPLGDREFRGSASATPEPIA